MNRLRIVCKAPPQPDDARYTIVPGWTDCEVYSVAADGTEIPLTNVQSISFQCSAGFESTATLTFVNVEIEADAELVPNASTEPARGGAQHASMEPTLDTAAPSTTTVPAVECSGAMCHEPAEVYSGSDFGWVCSRCLRRIEDTCGT